LSFAIFDKNWTDQHVKDACTVSSKLIDYLLEKWTPEVHVYNINIPLFPGVLTTKIFFTRLLENRSGSLFRLLSPEENHKHEQTINDAAKAEQKLREEGTTKKDDIEDDETEWHDDSDMLAMKDVGGIKRWTWSVDFKGLEAFVEEHGQKGGGMTDGWCLNRRWGSVTALKAAFQVVDGGAGGIHGGEEIVL
jgi:broad specificity polyphosphatase/5'/3'-nucleotidase SurE